jgi:hypothetical protein
VFHAQRTIRKKSNPVISLASSGKKCSVVRALCFEESAATGAAHREKAAGTVVDAAPAVLSE